MCSFNPPALAIAILIGISLCGCSKQSQETTEVASFATPNEAVDALVNALEQKNLQQSSKILNVDATTLSSNDPVADERVRTSFLKRYQAHHELVAGGADDLVLMVGEDDWPLPIPLVRREGRWMFDGPAGADELIARRIGANELHTIAVMRGYVDAQGEYASQGHDGASAGIYAQRIRSDAGKQNGLYWETAPGHPSSPLGPFIAAATDEGYVAAKPGMPYYGYRYRMLFSQGPAAQGGARDYLVGGDLKNGFAAIAYPDVYGKTGVMTFIVNQDGVVWQRDLGSDTAQIAATLQQFNPDQHWTPLVEDLAVSR